MCGWVGGVVVAVHDDLPDKYWRVACYRHSVLSRKTAEQGLLCYHCGRKQQQHRHGAGGVHHRQTRTSAPGGGGCAITTWFAVLKMLSYAHESGRHHCRRYTGAKWCSSMVGVTIDLAHWRRHTLSLEGPCFISAYHPTCHSVK